MPAPQAPPAAAIFDLQRVSTSSAARLQVWIKSNASARMVRTGMAISLWPVMTIAGILLPAAGPGQHFERSANLRQGRQRPIDGAGQQRARDDRRCLRQGRQMAQMESGKEQWGPMTRIFEHSQAFTLLHPRDDFPPKGTPCAGQSRATYLDPTDPPNAAPRPRSGQGAGRRL